MYFGWLENGGGHIWQPNAADLKPPTQDVFGTFPYYNINNRDLKNVIHICVSFFWHENDIFDVNSKLCRISALAVIEQVIFLPKNKKNRGIHFFQDRFFIIIDSLRTKSKSS